MAAGEGFEPSHTESESAVVLSSFIIECHFVSFVTDENVSDLSVYATFYFILFLKMFKITIVPRLSSKMFQNALGMTNG